MGNFSTFIELLTSCCGIWPRNLNEVEQIKIDNRNWNNHMDGIALDRQEKVFDKIKETDKIKKDVENVIEEATEEILHDRNKIKEKYKGQIVPDGYSEESKNSSNSSSKSKKTKKYNSKILKAKNDLEKIRVPYEYKMTDYEHRVYTEIKAHDPIVEIYDEKGKLEKKKTRWWFKK